MATYLFFDIFNRKVIEYFQKVKAFSRKLRKANDIFSFFHSICSKIKENYYISTKKQIIGADSCTTPMTAMHNPKLISYSNISYLVFCKSFICLIILSAA